MLITVRLNLVLLNMVPVNRATRSNPIWPLKLKHLRGEALDALNHLLEQFERFRELLAVIFWQGVDSFR
jgi:hypothetical protein